MGKCVEPFLTPGLGIVLLCSLANRVCATTDHSDNYWVESCTVLDLRTTTSQDYEAVPNRARM